MKDLSSWLITIFMGMFWLFRVIVTIITQSSGDFGGFIAFDVNMEIILLFITLVSIILVVRRNLIGATLYLVTYGYYFGGYLLKTAIPALSSTDSIDMIVAQNALVAALGLLLAIFTFLNILLEKAKHNKYTDKKTDWFFDNKETDREKDEKADDNHYKFY